MSIFPISGPGGFISKKQCLKSFVTISRISHLDWSNLLLKKFFENLCFQIKMCIWIDKNNAIESA